ncbi:RecA-superfamily ATPase implicated in signal transduction-like protein [Natrinema pellirubrum DSM 15624]|uniref:KaiC n=1 Tax=Natrinema pellirubrum (strain DSM 15624 / CIP 106293 / JCM 10476 / NCIMB 786 / 157) TaxID=797303 RepID=L0JJ96_NATP1|nr:ATPase domain-containing protein [Natrinema pellirubrum]AGB30406.1 KaiC [Natrinema pellirubrum DSM 15624]ELY79368.1 RecA-superfamily ATPase implicated in signal transduction-like protein [Natrinema pellirubrum DSM 15624]
MSDQLWTDRAREYPLECDHCHYPIPGEPEADEDGRYCSAACREAAGDGATMPDPDAYKRVMTGVEPLDSLVPDGIPADSLLLLSGDEGTRRAELGTELVWRALERGEPAVVCSVANPPTATLERFYENGWNVLPALERDRLRIVDCFTHRLDDRDEFRAGRNEWATFLGEAAADAVVEVEAPSDRREVANGLHRALDDLEMTETGLVTIDSLDELESLSGSGLVHDFVKDVRATVCMARFVPIVAAATTAGQAAYPETERVFDGIVDLRLRDGGAAETRHKQLAVRKLTGAAFLPQWVTYDYEPARGLFASGPNTDTRQARDLGNGSTQSAQRR